MKKGLKLAFKILGYTLGGILAILLVGIAYLKITSSNEASKQRKLLGAETKTITVEGVTFRDLNKNGKLDTYEDTRASLDSRVNDLVSQMSLEEKAGSMFITMAAMGNNGKVVEEIPISTDINSPLLKMPARAWGAEHLNYEERVQKIIDAGCDMFGGESCPELVVQLVKSGKVSEARIDQSVKRLMRQKFILGLFDNPYVDIENATKNVGRPEWNALGEQAQRRALTLLKNEGGVLPLQEKKYKIFIKGIKKEVAEQYGTVVAKPEQADFALIRTNTPYVPVENGGIIASMFHHGDLDFKGKEKAELVDICQKVPTIFTIFLDRPAVLTDINAVAKGVIGDYGANDSAVLDVIFGKAKPEGKLPFELPSSMEAVRNQKEDVPYDSKDPLYPFGFGLSYK